MSRAIFVYSDSQFNLDKGVHRSIGENLICGEVSVKSEKKKFSKMLYNDQALAAMCNNYPDTKIVADIDKATAKFTEVHTEPVRK